MTTNNPKTIAGKIYPELALNLSVSPLIRKGEVGDFLSTSVVLKLSPMRRENGKIEILSEQEYQNTIVVFDAFLHNDIHFLSALAIIQESLQNFIDAKNL